MSSSFVAAIATCTTEVSPLTAGVLQPFTTGGEEMRLPTFSPRGEIRRVGRTRTLFLLRRWRNFLATVILRIGLPAHLPVESLRG